MNFYYAFLGFLNFRKFLNFDKNKKILFFSESKNYRNYFFSLLKSLETEKNISIIYLTSDINDKENISDKIKTFFIGAGFLRILIFTFIKCEMIIMTLTDLGNHEIKKSKNCKNYVYIFHALVSTHKCYTHTAFDNYDIILCNGEYQEKELRLCEKLFNLKEKKIYNTGYLYFEKLLEERKRLAQKDTKKKILFAVSWNKNRNNLFDNYAENILRKLVDLNYQVVLRTHPESVKRSYKTLKKISENLQKFNNFKINTDLTNLNPLNESSILITDDGGIALEYLIIYRKPVLYIDHLKKIHNIFFDKIELESLEDQFRQQVGTSMRIADLDNINFFIKKAETDFQSKKGKIDELIFENKIILKNQANNAKNIILKFLFNNKN